MPRQAEDLTGKVFGTRKVIKRAKSRDYAGYKTIYWRVQCLACGHKTEVQGGSLRRGAGCGPCTSGKPAAPAGRGRRVKRPPPAGKQQASATQQGAPLTVAQLTQMLAQLPNDSTLHVHLVSKQGWALRPITNVNLTGSMTVFFAELPAQIEPWKS